MTSFLFQVGSFTNERAAGNPSGQKTSDCGQTVVVADSAKLSGSLVVTNRSLHVEVPDCKHPKGLKKKHMKCKVAGMHFRPCLLSRAVLSVRKKKKHKRSKHPTSDCKSLSKKYLIDTYCSSSDLGPSTSEKTQTDSLVSARSKRKRNKSGLKTDADGTSNKCVLNPHGDSSKDVKDVEFRESLVQNGMVLASDKQLQNGFSSSSVTLENQRESGGTATPHNYKKDAMQNGWKGVLTQGPEETVGE